MEGTPLENNPLRVAETEILRDQFTPEQIELYFSSKLLRDELYQKGKKLGVDFLSSLHDFANQKIKKTLMSEKGALGEGDIKTAEKEVERKLDECIMWHALSFSGLIKGKCHEFDLPGDLSIVKFLKDTETAMAELESKQEGA